MKNDNSNKESNLLKNKLCDFSIDQKISLKWSDKRKTQMRLIIDNIEFAVFKKHYNESFWRDLCLPNSKPPQGLLFLNSIGYKTIEDFVTFFNNDFEGIIKDIVIFDHK